MEKFSYTHHAHPQYIESLYKDFLADPQSVDESWRKFFEGFDFARAIGGKTDVDSEHLQKEFKVLNLIHGYRTRGHLFTKTNPVRTRRQYSPTLNLQNFGLSEKDLDTVFQAGSEIGIGPALLREITDHLKQTYCRSIGVEFMYIRHPARISWLKDKMESTRNTPDFSIEEKRHILQKLNQAVIFENFLHTKYVGQKRFSLQGGETLIPGLDAIIQKGADMGISEFVIGMPHRGRLNVLANILNKSYEEIFSEFEGDVYADSVFSGDVKYHLGYSGEIVTRNGHKVALHLAPNPSHLEAVDPVAEGIAKARADRKYGGDYTKIAPVLIHGDAAIAGQGVVYEVIQMSQLPAYHTGGTIHLVINNQLGFTTNYLEARSGTYCTDVAKVTLSPVFHVNADDVEEVVYAIRLAMEYRQTFHTDVFIDLLGYRKYGHNEGDEPRFTQPKLYKIIADHPDPREIYNQKLLQIGAVERGLAEEMETQFREMLQKQMDEVKGRKAPTNPVNKKESGNQNQRTRFDYESVFPTAVKKKKLLDLGEKIFTIPEEVKIFKKLRRIYNHQRDKFLKRQIADWSIAEFLVYATLLDEGVPIRLCGQDSRRGTFSNRHAVLLNEETEEEYIPLKKAETETGKFRIYNSLLSEYAALGFEYGYACATPHGLTVWEAQFGDFANGAQIIIDQFITVAESRWEWMNGIVLYLPHGYEGQGPEHSSARIERFLTLCARNNMTLANCTTPANFFHLLRRHIKMPFRAPLVIFTPKSLLRHPRCVSPISEFTKGGFRTVIYDDSVEAQKTKTVLICSGKIYYELDEQRQNLKRDDVAIVRLEQLYPLPENGILKLKKFYPQAKKFIWVQEEPENMGALSFLLRKLYPKFPFEYIARKEDASPATGYMRRHTAEQQEILEKAFSL
ncbi:MAG: 2-oxoglutarate dehydrogenase E1 component [Calditrichaeota bacterium]|nr:2-oxoglutarate dehydrogenase E1 component [Calditrichota bacterium]